MCGVNGFVGLSVTDEEVATGPRLRDLLVHRGPDGCGGLRIGDEDGAVSGLRGWLGHRRLRIIDTSNAADQPMTSDDGLIALVYNGEVYNFQELRIELERLGHRFRSTGDTEVVLRAYEAWGISMLDRIDGMFAFGVWDARRDRLLLARDRTGKKPLFYAADDDRITFGSEIKSVVAAPWVDDAPADDHLAQLLLFGYVPPPYTMYRCVHEVPPGSWVSYDMTGLDGPHEFWDLPRPTRGSGGLGESGSSIAGLLTQAVERRLVSDVPLGALLSGGVDSSILVGLMSRATPDPVRTFSAGFADDPSYDERSFARLVSEQFGTRHTEFTVRVDAMGLVDRLLWHHDQPFADSSAIPTFLVSELARQHVTVALTGDGGDEVFAGYDRFRAAAWAQCLPSTLQHGLGRLSPLLPRNSTYHSARRRLERFSSQAGDTVASRYLGWISVFDQGLLESLLTPAAGGPEGALLAAEPMEAVRRRREDEPELDRLLYANFRTYLPGDLSVKLDRMSMANSLETRCPFLDTALIEAIARIPASRKIGWRQVKPVLREAFGPLLPKEVWDRRKHGFGVPVGSWFRSGDLADLFIDEVLATDARSRQYLRPSVVHALFDEHQRGSAEHGARLWTLLVLERWLRGAHLRTAAPSGVLDGTTT